MISRLDESRDGVIVLAADLEGRGMMWQIDESRDRVIALAVDLEGRDVSNAVRDLRCRESDAMCWQSSQRRRYPQHGERISMVGRAMRCLDSSLICARSSNHLFVHSVVPGTMVVKLFSHLAVW